MSHEEETELKAEVAAELRESKPEGLPDEKSISKAAVFLNKKLPKTRVIAQAVVYDDDGAVLVCELSYKRFRDLPGGVVDPHESPAQAVVREMREELGVEATIHGLRVISWLPPWRGWDDAMLFVFEATLDRPVSQFTLQRKEIAGVSYLRPDELDAHVATYTAKVIRRAVQARDAGEFGIYLENGEDPAWA